MDCGDGAPHIVFPSTRCREAAVSLRGNVRNRDGKLVGRRHHVRSQDRARLPTKSGSTKRRLRTAISDASPSPRWIANTPSVKTPRATSAKVFGEVWSICLVFSPVPSSRSCSRRSTCPAWTWRSNFILSLFASRRTMAIVMADELRVAPENIPSCSEKPLPTKSSRSRPCSRRSTCAPWTWRCKLFCSCAPRDARQASSCTLVTVCGTRIASGNPSFNFWSSRPHGISDEDHPILRSDVPMLFFFRCGETQINFVISTDALCAAIPWPDPWSHLFNACVKKTSSEMFYSTNAEWNILRPLKTWNNANMLKLEHLKQSERP